MVSLDQFKAGFLTECDELLTDMEAMLVELTPESADKDTLNAIFRCAHSIKGGSGAFGLDAIMQFTHILEALLDAMRDDRVQVTRAGVDALLQAVDILNSMISHAKEDTNPPADLGRDLAVKLENLAKSKDDKHEESTPALQNIVKSIEISQHQTKYLINFIAYDSLFLSGNEPLLILRELESFGNSIIKANIEKLPSLENLEPSNCYLTWDIELTTNRSLSAIKEVFEFVEDHCKLSITEVKEEATNPPAINKTSEEYGIFDLPPQNTTPTNPDNNDSNKKDSANQFNRRASDAAASSTIRVDLDKVDKLVNIVGELVITEAMLKAQMRGLPADQFASLMRGVDDLSHHTRELQEAVMSVRMQPVKSIFSRMPRIVRDLSAQLGKDIVLHTEGENTEVDKTVIEQLGDPLTHMIRNSVDHGIEKPEVRIANGKEAQGNIKLSAMHQGGRIIIEISDDGAGINRAKVLAKAKEKGLFPQDATLSDEECDNIIFMAGFSTADIVSNVSGRGVGMDVVRRNIEALDGTVRVASESGKGSVFTVSLPLTLAILDGMIVRVGSESYVIPITSIIETMRPKKSEIRHVEGNFDVINVRGEFIPIIYLHEIFYIEGAMLDPSNALVVLVEAGRDKIGLVVDELIGQQQVVIKSLEVNSDPVKGISGATILGDGKVSLILEIPQIKQLASELQQKILNQIKATA
jgi:two-component system chemotaxis sensor kinase CheA